MREELEEIKKIRVRNNDLWLELVDIALKHAPVDAKRILAQISTNDRLVSDYVGDIVYENLK